MQYGTGLANRGDGASASLASRIFETGTVILAAAGVVATAMSAAAPGAHGNGHPVSRFLSVLGVILVSLALYKRSWAWRVREEARSFVASSEIDLKMAKDQFIANVSHGLRTPLTGIVGFSHILKEDLEHSEGRHAVDMILGESAELSRIVDDLLITARLDAGVLEIKLEDSEFVDQMAPVIDFLFLLGAKVGVDCQPARINVDPQRFRHILRNLLVNAHRHGQPQVTVTGYVRDGRYICDVADQGPGVPASEESRLFTRFAYRDPQAGSGHVGLGLAVVKSLCDHMDCQVSYRRYRGRTHFVLSVPLASEGQIHDESRSRPSVWQIRKLLSQIKDWLVREPAPARGI